MYATAYMDITTVNVTEKQEQKEMPNQNSLGGDVNTLRKILREVKEMNLLIKELKELLNESTTNRSK